MQMETTLLSPRASISAPAPFKRLGGKRGLLGGLGLALVGAGLAWQWSWLVAIGVAPLLVSLRRDVRARSLHAPHVQQHRRRGTQWNFTKIFTSAGELR